MAILKALTRLAGLAKRGFPGTGGGTQGAIAEIIELIRRNDIVILCGAGISFRSGLPIANTLIAHVLEMLPATPEQRKTIQNAALPFELIMQRLIKISSVNSLLDVFDVGAPNANHILIARLLKSGHLPICVTTNFDHLIEDALETETGSARCKFMYKGSDFEQTLDSDEAPVLAKIHGSIHDVPSIVTTIASVAARRLVEPRRRMIEHIFLSGDHKVVLVLGYSWSDEFDLSPAIRNLKGSRRKRVIYVDHSNKNRAMGLTTLPVNNPFADYSGVRVCYDIGGAS